MKVCTDTILKPMEGQLEKLRPLFLKLTISHGIMFQRATGNLRHPILLLALLKPFQSCPSPKFNYIYRLNDAFIGTVTFSSENNMVNFILRVY